MLRQLQDLPRRQRHDSNTTAPTTTLNPIQNFCGVDDVVVLDDDADVGADVIAGKK